MSYQLSGMPTEGRELYMENYGYLLNMPWFQYIDATVAKSTCSFYRYLLDNAPIVGDKKHVLVTARLQYLTPNSLSIHYADDWHVDGESHNDDRMHLLISPSTARTQFNSVPLTIYPKGMDYESVNIAVNKHRDHLNRYAKEIQPNRFYTFDKSHAHRAVNPRVPEFRFMFRIIETDNFVGESYFTHETQKFFINKDGKLDSTWSIRRDEKGIQINPY